MALLKRMDIVITNATYPFKIGEKETLEENMELLASYGMEVLITTLGEKGSCAFIDGKVKYFPAYKIKTVDTTGAGDVFHGAFLAAYYRGFSIEEAIQYATAVSALKCLKIGGRNGIPSDEEVHKFIKENN